MLGKSIGAMFALVALFVVLAGAIPVLVENSEDSRTEAVIDTGLNCSTGVGETTCTFSLTDAHAYASTSEMTVTETSPSSVDRTAQTTVSADRADVTVSGLTASTAYVFTVAHDRVNQDISQALAGLLQALPVIIVVGALFVVLAGVAVAFRGR